MRGRPSKYTPSIGKEICRRLAEGETLRQICRDESMPPQTTVSEWGTNPDHPFFGHYAKARLAGYAKMADELIEISDDGSNDWMEREGRDGEAVTVVDHEHIARSRLRVDTRKWLLSKMLPKVYGDKIEATVNASVTVKVVRFSDQT